MRTRRIGGSRHGAVMTERRGRSMGKKIGAYKEPAGAKKRAESDRPVEFATPELVEAARKDLQAARTKEDVADVWRRHVMTVGHRRLGRLLMGKDPERR
jgi:hypothetical protein